MKKQIYAALIAAIQFGLLIASASSEYTPLSDDTQRLGGKRVSRTHIEQPAPTAKRQHLSENVTRIEDPAILAAQADEINKERIRTRFENALHGSNYVDKVDALIEYGYYGDTRDLLRLENYTNRPTLVDDIDPLAVPLFNQSSFEANATLYGNKTANLFELEKIVPYLNNRANGNKNFAVPPLFGLSDWDIVGFLQKNIYQGTPAWLYILAQWKSFIAGQKDAQQTTLTDAARQALTNIRKALNETSFDITTILNEDDTRHQNLMGFIDNAKESNSLLMVRSTGREDSSELSNAGGNASISSVSPHDLNAISNAIKEVLKSYFSEKSISQRLVGKDNRLFDIPFMAVLLQVMIGENSGQSNEIPKSGVIFSPEAEGETPGVVVIQATFGHNEGVVNSLVPVDTYIVGPSHIIHPVIRIKDKRLTALAGQPGLHFVPNSFEQKSGSTLDPQTVLACKQAAQLIEQYYGKAIDIEFVILDNTIYLLQARPLEAKEFHASFLSHNYMNTAQSVIPVTAIGVGDGAVRIIRHPHQVIVSANIRDALNTFLTKTPDQEAVQAIIIHEWAPNTSHEATQFRRLGKPVIFLQQPNTLTTWIEQLGSPQSVLPTASYAATSTALPLFVEQTHGNPVLIDVQRSVVTQFVPTYEFETPESAVESGWYAHPIAKEISLMSEFFPKLTTAQMRALTPAEFFTGRTTSELINIIKTGEQTSAQHALRSLLHRVLTTLRKIETVQKLSPPIRPNLVPQLKLIFSYILASAYEINETLTRQHITRLEYLYPIVFLEALLTQIPQPKLLVNDYSFVSLLKTEKQEQNIVQNLQLQGDPFRSYIVQYAKAGEHALNPAIQEHWYSFLKNMSANLNQNLQQEFARMMLNLASLDILPMWLNTSFEDAYKIFPHNVYNTTQTLVTEYNDISNFIKKMLELHSVLSSVNTTGNENTEAYIKQTKVLLQTINALKTKEFLDAVNSANGLKLFIILQVMRKAVETFDSNIKMLLANTSFTDRQKISLFKGFMERYFNLLATWLNIPKVKKIVTNFDRTSNSRDTDNPKRIDRYLQSIGQALKNTGTDLKELYPSSNMNVAISSLRGEGTFSSKLTLEDIFTLTHQNLLIVLSSLTPRLNPDSLPPLFNEIIEKMEHNDELGKKPKNYNLKKYMDDADMDSVTPFFISASFDNNQLTYYMNLPLREHSIMYEITYNILTHEIFLTSNSFGANELHRWDIQRGLIHLISKLIGTNIIKENASDIESDDPFFSFTLQISNFEQVTPIILFLRMLSYQSMDYSDPTLLASELNLVTFIASITGKNADTIFNAVCELLYTHPFLFELKAHLPKKEKYNPCFVAVAQKLVRDFAASDVSERKKIINVQPYFDERNKKELVRIILDNLSLLREVIIMQIKRPNFKTNIHDEFEWIIDQIENVADLEKISILLQDITENYSGERSELNQVKDLIDKRFKELSQKLHFPQ